MPGVLREATHPRASGMLSGRFLLVSGAVLIAALALLPIAGLLREGLLGLTRGNANLGPDGLAQVRGTVTLLLGTASLGGLVGTANGWLRPTAGSPVAAGCGSPAIPLATPSICLLPHWST